MVTIISIFVLLLIFFCLWKKKRGKSVSKKLSEIRQPKGGYLPLKLFDKTVLGESWLFENENVSSSKVGMAVDYLTRIETGTPKDEPFKIALKEAQRIGQKTRAKELLRYISGLSDWSIISAVRLCGYETQAYSKKKTLKNVYVNDETIANIRTMVKRSVKMLEFYGGRVWSGFTFEGGYTANIAYGEGDFLTPNTLWDFKTYKGNLNTKNTLQILIYWRMGIHSRHEIYKHIKYLGLYNPRSNTAYRIPIDRIPQETIEEIDSIIGYRRSKK